MAEAAIKSLDELQRQEVSIVALGEAITGAHRAQRASDASDADAPTPARLEADLAHYRELFAKLRFSYVEQVTKEKFIRAIVGDPPLMVTPHENADLEQQNAAAKAALQALKADVQHTVAELERRGRELARRHARVASQTARLRELPAEAAAVERSVAALKTALAALQSHHDPAFNLPLAATLNLVAQRARQERDLDRELERLHAQMPRRQNELARLEAELQPLEARRQHSAAAAAEARRRKDTAVGAEDDLEGKGRWWRANEAVLERVLGEMRNDKDLVIT